MTPARVALLVVIAGMAGFIVGRLFFPPSVVTADSPAATQVEDAAPQASIPLPPIQRASPQAPPTARTVAVASEATLRWRQDPELLATIKADFDRTFETLVAETEADAEAKRHGNRSIQNAIAACDETTPGLQFRVEDFSTLTENQKNNLYKLLYAVANEYSVAGSRMPADLSPEGASEYLEDVSRRAPYLPPELVLDSLGLREKLDHQDFAIQVRALRVQIYNQAASHYSDLYNTTRFALGAVMRQGVDPTTLGDWEGNAALVTPLVREHQLRLEQLSRAFVLGCEEIGRRFD
jgi:hypothetical protein